MVDRGVGSEAFILCTQPRRVAAISVAERVAAERGEKCGETVGFQVRFYSSGDSDKTRIVFCTTGILLRKIQDDAYLSMVSHIIIDEVWTSTHDILFLS
jgi:HrpA-like RNA helicase